MPLVNAGRDFIAAAIINSGPPTFFNNANAFLGVGDSATAFAVTQTDLQAATNKTRKAMDATYPQVAANVITFRSTFATTDANYTWAEWGIFNASTAGTMLSRLVQALGTKVNTATWQLTATLTLTV